MDQRPPGRGAIRVARRARATRAALAAAVLLVAAGGLAGCGGGSGGGSGGDDGATTTTTAAGGALSSDDLDRLSLFLLRDHQVGGARVEVRFESSGRTVTMTGVVDWAGHAGDLDVVDAAADPAAGTNADDTDRYEVRFTADHVYESLDDAEVDRLAAAGRPGVRWAVRAPSPSDDPLDRILALLISFAAEQPDNPALLAGKGYTLASREDDAGSAVTTYRSATDALYGVDDELGVLVRFQGVVAGIDEPVTVDLSDHGAHAVDVPEAATTVAADESVAG